MPKTPEQVIAKLQRRLQNASDHIMGLIESQAGWKKMSKRMEDTLAYAWRQLDAIPKDAHDVYQEVPHAMEAIENSIPTRIKKEQEKRGS